MIPRHFPYLGPVQEQVSPYASFTNRALARIIDIGLISVPLNMLMLVSLVFLRSLPLALLWIILDAAYKPIMESHWGYTLGKKWRKIKVISQETGGLMDMNQSLTRFIPWAIAYFASIFVYTRHFQDPAFGEVTTMEQYFEFAASHVLSGNFLISVANNLTIFSAVWMFSDPFRRALHDRFAKTIVVNDVDAIEREKNVGWED